MASPRPYSSSSDPSRGALHSPVPESETSTRAQPGSVCTVNVNSPPSAPDGVCRMALEADPYTPG